MSKPNILFICTDQQRRASLGLFSKDEYKDLLTGAADPVHTPNIDALADEGIIITEAYSSYPVCSPFRAMLFSGLYPEDNGVKQNCAPGRPDELRADIPTFTDVLADNGYDVGYVGKWHLEMPRADFDQSGNYIAENAEYSGERFYADGSPEAAPTCWDTLIPESRRRGIDYLYAYNTYDVFRYSESTPILKRPRLFDRDYKRHMPPPDVWSADFETDVALNFLKNDAGQRRKSEPFALFVNYNPPHSPYASIDDTDRDAYEKHYKHADAEKRLPMRENLAPTVEDFEEKARVYFSHVCGIDRCVGRLLDALDEIGERENTIVVYTSDHGEMMGSHGLMAKNVPYEEATAIPFVIRYPRALNHRAVPLFITAVDMMPTVLGLAGIEKPSGLAGEDYSNLLSCGEGEMPSAALFTQPKRKGVRTRDYLLTIAYGTDDRHGETMLFDMKADPYQMNNLPLSAIPEAQLNELLRLLGSMLKKANDPWYKKRLYSDLILYGYDTQPERSD